MKEAGRVLTLAELTQRRNALLVDVADLRLIQATLSGLTPLTERRRVWARSVIDNEIGNAERQIVRYNGDIDDTVRQEKESAKARREKRREENENVLILGGVRYKLEPLPEPVRPTWTCRFCQACQATNEEANCSQQEICWICGHERGDTESNS